MLDRARAGDREALAHLLGPELDRIYAVCRRMVRGRGDAEDLAQEALVRIIRGLPSFDGRSSLSTWMTRVAINTCLSWGRSRSRRSEITLAFPPEAEPDRPAGVQSEPEEVARIDRALERLSPEHRAILVLRDVRELDYEQIGAALDLPVGTVKSRLFRARAAFREAMAREIPPPIPDAPP
jgi:RNA polymerase sigma-70 factor (ECF subfamily)